MLNYSVYEIEPTESAVKRRKNMMFNQLFEKGRLLDKFPLNDAKLISSNDLKINQERTKLWDLEHHYHCAVIGIIPQ